MSWEHFEITDRKICKVLNIETGEILDCKYELGTVSTGKQRVFYGYRIAVYIGDKCIIGDSKGYSESYRLALKDCNTKMAAEGFILLVAGNSSNYSESPMSGGAGCGYRKGEQKGVHIMSFSEHIAKEILSDNTNLLQPLEK